MQRSICLLAASIALLLAPGPALAQLGGGGGQLGAPETPDVPAPVTQDPTDDGWETWQTLLVTAAGVLLIAGIGVAIVGDARRAAPVTEEDLRHEQARFEDAAGERVHTRGGKARARKKQKVARQSRKRNRARR
jgi:hypothetical protein